MTFSLMPLTLHDLYKNSNCISVTLNMAKVDEVVQAKA